MRVTDVMRREPLVATPGMSLERVGRLMAEVDCGFLPVVVDGGEVAGVITDRDVCLALTTRGRRPADLEVRQVMSGEVWSCGADEELTSALRVMAERKVHRLPVVDEDKHLAGVLSIDDVLVEARPHGEGGHPSFEDVAATLQQICRHVIPAVR